MWSGGLRCRRRRLVSPGAALLPPPAELPTLAGCRCACCIRGLGPVVAGERSLLDAEGWLNRYASFLGDGFRTSTCGGAGYECWCWGGGWSKRVPLPPVADAESSVSRLRLALLPPRREGAKTHSRFSRRQREQGGSDGASMSPFALACPTTRRALQARRGRPDVQWYPVHALLLSPAFHRQVALLERSVGRVATCSYTIDPLGSSTHQITLGFPRAAVETVCQQMHRVVEGGVCNA